MTAATKPAGTTKRGAKCTATAAAFAVPSASLRIAATTLAGGALVNVTPALEAVTQALAIFVQSTFAHMFAFTGLPLPTRAKTSCNVSIQSGGAQP